MVAEQASKPHATEIRSRVPWDEYGAMRGVSITRLKELGRSPQHYKHRGAFPKESDALTLGSAAHVAILEPERFAHDHAVWDRETESGNSAPRRGKTWDAFVAANPGKRIITPAQLAQVEGMRDAVRSHKAAMRYLETGDPEVTMTWRHNTHECKGRVDWLTHLGGFHIVAGLKTTTDCRHFVFGSRAAKLGYHLQWAFYHDGYQAITRRDPQLVEIVVESAPPHAVAVFRITQDIIDQGRDEYIKLLDVLSQCRADNRWPGPHEDEEDLSLPSWVYGTDDEGDDISDLGLEA